MIGFLGFSIASRVIHSAFLWRQTALLVAFPYAPRPCGSSRLLQSSRLPVVCLLGLRGGMDKFLNRRSLGSSTVPSVTLKGDWDDEDQACALNRGLRNPRMVRSVPSAGHRFLAALSSSSASTNEDQNSELPGISNESDLSDTNASDHLGHSPDRNQIGGHETAPPQVESIQKTPAVRPPNQSSPQRTLHDSIAQMAATARAPAPPGIPAPDLHPALPRSKRRLSPAPADPPPPHGPPQPQPQPPAAAAAADEAALMAMRAADLRDLCRRRGAPTSGVQTALVQRLRPAPPPPPPGPGPIDGAGDAAAAAAGPAPPARRGTRLLPDR